MIADRSSSPAAGDLSGVRDEWVEKAAAARFGIFWPAMKPEAQDAARGDARAALAAVLPGIAAAVRGDVAAELLPILLDLSDEIDPEEGPVIIAWATPVLAERIAERISRTDAAVSGD